MVQSKVNMAKLHTCVQSIFIMFFLLVPAAYADQRVDGVAQFLMDRARDNYIYIYERDIKASEAFQCYFPQTYKNLTYSGLKEVLLFPKSLWETSLEKDLNTLTTRAVAKSLSQRIQYSDLWDGYIELLQALEIRHKGQFYAIDSLPITARNDDPELVAAVKRFSEVPERSAKAFTYLKEFDQLKLCDTPVTEFNDFRKSVLAIAQIDKELASIGTLFSDHIADQTIRIKPAIVNQARDDVKKRLDSFLSAYPSNDNVNDLKNDLAALVDIVNTIHSDVSMTEKVIKVFHVIDPYQLEGIDEARPYVMFFAQIRDSKNATQVAEVLKAYTLPSVSFFEKREHSVAMVQSYLGITSYGGEGSIENDYGAVGVYAPIGVEWSTPAWGGSLSFMIAPFDFGYPVSVRLNETDQQSTWQQVIAPSVVMSYGIPNYPFSIGVGYQKSSIENQLDQREERVFLHASFDMPLLSLF